MISGRKSRHVDKFVFFRLFYFYRVFSSQSLDQLFLSVNTYFNWMAVSVGDEDDDEWTVTPLVEQLNIVHRRKLLHDNCLGDSTSSREEKERDGRYC